MQSYRVFAAALGAVACIYCGKPSSAPDDAQGTGDGVVDDAPVPPLEEERPIPGLAAVWAVHDGEKVEPDDLAHPARSGNTAWRGDVVRLFGGRNEVIAFQVIVEADETGVSGLDVDLAGLHRRGGGGSIVYAPPGEDPTNTVGRPIGPGAGVGNTIAPASFYGPGTAYDDRASAWATSNTWMTNLAAKVPGARTFLYMPDEPSPAQYPRIRTIADNVHSNPGPGRALPIFVTRAFNTGLDGAIDIWCAWAGAFQPSRAIAERAKGRSYWFYNGMRPATGALTIDSPATDARVIAWAAFKHDVDVYFYWHANHWRHNFQKHGERDQNVWENPVTFDNRGQPNKPISDQGFIHGDGVLLYPGEEVLHPAHDRGIAGPIGTIQLANLRRGLQDHLYFTLARQRGFDAEVTAALAEIVPAVFFDAGSTVRFPQTGDPYEEVRYRLAKLLASP